MAKTDLSRFDNSDYRPGNPLLIALWYFVNITFVQSRWIPFSAPRRFLLRLFGASIGKRVVIRPGVKIKYPWRLRIGDNSWIGEDVWIDNLGEVSIGNNCCISQGALLLCGNHDYSKSTFDLMVGDIHLEEGVWVGAKAIVTGGVRCANHSVLAAGSMTSKDLKEHTIYSGHPAVEVRSRKIVA